MVKGPDLIAPEFYNITVDIDRHADGNERTAIYWEDDENHSGSISYEELQALSNKLGNALKNRGLTKGDKILVFLPRIPETYIAFIAALKLGMIVSPAPEMLREKDLLFRIEHSQAKAVICHHTLTNRIEQIQSKVKSLNHFIVVGKEIPGWDYYEKIIQFESPNLRIERTKSEDIAFLNYTSGTTGNPKGVLHSHGWAYAHRAVAATYWLDLKSTDVVWSTASPGWAKWIQNAFIATLGTGASSFTYYGSQQPEKYLQVLEKYKINVFCATPTEYRLIAKVENLESYKLPFLRNTLSAGEPLDKNVTQTFLKTFNVQIRDGYGQTENTLLVATLKGMEVKTGSMGKPTPGNKVDIIDEHGDPAAVDQVGMIAVHRSVPGLFKGYLNDFKRTSAAFNGDWYITGDLAKKDKDGYFWFQGRSDDIIISSGYTIGPSEVEEALGKHPLVMECAVVSSPDMVRGAIVKAFVVLRENVTPTKDLVKELQDHVKAFTAPYKYPREIEFVSTLPKTGSGKIRRVELRQLEWQKKQHPIQNL